MQKYLRLMLKFHEQTLMKYAQTLRLGLKKRFLSLARDVDSYWPSVAHIQNPRLHEYPAQSLQHFGYVQTRPKDHENLGRGHWAGVLKSVLPMLFALFA